MDGPRAGKQSTHFLVNWPYLHTPHEQNTAVCNKQLLREGDWRGRLFQGQNKTTGRAVISEYSPKADDEQMPLPFLPCGQDGSSCLPCHGQGLLTLSMTLRQFLGKAFMFCSMNTKPSSLAMEALGWELLPARGSSSAGGLQPPPSWGITPTPSLDK